MAKSGSLKVNSAFRLIFARGEAPKDPSGLYNFGFDGNIRRPMDFQALLRAAVTLNS